MGPYFRVRHPVQRKLIEYWRKQAGDRRMPARHDLDPVDIPGLLPHVGLIDVEESGTRFRYRLIGTNMNAVFGIDFTDTYLDESKHGEYRDFLDGLYRSCAAGPHIVYSESEFGYRDRTHLSIARLLLPLSSNGEAVDMLLFSNMFWSKHGTEVDRRTPPFVADLIISIEELIREEAPVD